MKKQKSRIKKDPEFTAVHEALGCKGCRYCDKKALNRGPCCTFYGKLDVDMLGTGKCLTRRGEERQHPNQKS